MAGKSSSSPTSSEDENSHQNWVFFFIDADVLLIVLGLINSLKKNIGVSLEKTTCHISILLSGYLEVCDFVLINKKG